MKRLLASLTLLGLALVGQSSGQTLGGLTMHDLSALNMEGNLDEAVRNADAYFTRTRPQRESGEIITVVCPLSNEYGYTRFVIRTTQQKPVLGDILQLSWVHGSGFNNNDRIHWTFNMQAYAVHGATVKYRNPVRSLWYGGNSGDYAKYLHVDLVMRWGDEPLSFKVGGEIAPTHGVCKYEMGKKELPPKQDSDPAPGQEAQLDQIVERMTVAVETCLNAPLRGCNEIQGFTEEFRPYRSKLTPAIWNHVRNDVTKRLKEASYPDWQSKLVWDEYSRLQKAVMTK